MNVKARAQEREREGVTRRRDVGGGCVGFVADRRKAGFGFLRLRARDGEGFVSRELRRGGLLDAKM